MSTAAQPIALVQKSPDALLNSREVAEMLNVDVSWVKNHCTRVKPRLPFVRLGDGLRAPRRFRREQIEQFIEMRTQVPREML